MVRTPGARRGAVAGLALFVAVAGLAAGDVAAAVPALPSVALPSVALPARPDSAADRKRALDRELDDLRETLEGTAEDLVDAAVDLRRSRSEMRDADTRLRGARAALAAARRRDEALAGRLEVAQAAVLKAERDLAARDRQERETRRRLGGIAREAYLRAGVSSGMSIALNAVSPQQFTDQVAIAGTALRHQNGTLARLAVQQADTRARRTRLAAARARVAELKRESEQVVAARDAAEDEASAASAKIRELVDVRARAVRTIRARRAAERDRVAALEREQDELADLLRARARRAAQRAAQRARSSEGSGGSSGPSSGGGGSDGGSGLSYPVNAPVTSGFGYRYHPILHYSRLHAGTDFGAGCGTPVRAAAGGTVARAGRAGGYGNQVVVEHGQIRGRSIATSSNHLSRIAVHRGPVRRGQVIGYVGTTGLSTGCHLHFEVYANGTHVNPMNWL